MEALVDFLLRFVSFRACLMERGWTPPIETKGGGGGPKPEKGVIHGPPPVK